jgi:hypothetical protein
MCFTNFLEKQFLVEQLGPRKHIVPMPFFVAKPDTDIDDFHRECDCKRKMISLWKIKDGDLLASY